MLQLLVIVVVATVVIGNKDSIVIVRSESLPICGYSSKTSVCPGDRDRVEIKSPFWIENRTVDEVMGRRCISYPGFQITCAASGRPVINISSNLYYVIDIIDDQYNKQLRIADVDIDAEECPQPRRNISITSVPFLSYSYYTMSMTFLYNCSNYPANVVQRIPCLNEHYNTSTHTSFAFLEAEFLTNQFDWYANCQEAVFVPVDSDPDNLRKRKETNYTRSFKDGFRVDFTYPVNCRNCELSGGQCLPNVNNVICNCTDTLDGRLCLGQYQDLYEGYYRMPIRLKIVIGISIGIAGMLLSLCVLYRRKCYPLCISVASTCRKKIKGSTNVEMFLANNHEDISSHSYKYSDIKKMTNYFNDTLGQGGYGSVFKGKLRDGRLVAVKVLSESKGKGEDFINEVASMGRTNHVNVVSLLGFCAEGTKRALVYEFMPNGSLEKFIHNAKDSSTTNSLLGWEKLYQIALGIARGLEYLHRGCNTRILHFDIKPHNILLDQDFCPKISDFGLAKLCPTRESLVSMVGARGTIGYIAPEVCCRNFGGVSHKSDVYSYGMMVLEMIGGRKNIDATVENISEIYFPQWIYKRLRGEIKVEGSEKSKMIRGEAFKEEETQKMIIVALWCIQAHPGDRPSMTHVVEMLEGKIEDLHLPPNPFPDSYTKPFPSSS